MLTLASSMAAVAADVNVSGGELAGILADEKIKKENALKLQGSIDARDLAAIEKLPVAIKQLDLREVKITPLTMPDRSLFGRTLFSEGEIPAYTFFKSGVESLMLPAATTAICEGAFAASALKEIELPAGVTSIGSYAFYGCTDLRSVDLSKTAVTELPPYVFAGCVNLESVKLPPTVVRVGREAFSHTAVKSLTLDRIESFEPYALSGMPYLEELVINPYAEIGDGLLMDNVSLLSLTGVPEAIPDYFATNCSTLPAETMAGGAVVGRYSFANTAAADELILPASVSRIERGALAGLSSLKHIDATALEGNLPAVDATTFEGLSQPDIDLWVTDDSFDLWKSDPVWGLFNVVANSQTSVDEIPGADADAISIRFRGASLLVEAATAVADVRIYTPDGRVAYVASPGEQRVEIAADLLPAGILIVAATDAEGNARTATLLH